tara:strand:- start:12819 stop:12968 length:150 start_codon:yes stop_codon:yes gene_type:complete
MVKFVCKSCNYRFEREDAFDCPYCGNEEAIEKEQSAGELLQEIGDILEN